MGLAAGGDGVGAGAAGGDGVGAGSLLKPPKPPKMLLEGLGGGAGFEA
jgi:hypothetical protein